MPSSITHLLIAEDASDGFPQAIKNAVRAHPDYFFLGAQGPDPFFFLKILSKEKNFGSLLHAIPYETFTAFFSRYRSAPDERAAAYLAGYCSHYATDVVFHPFVYRYLQETNARGMAHQRMENDWDVFFLRRERGREAERFPAPFSPAEIAREGVVYELVCSVAAQIRRRLPTKRAFRIALKRFYRFVTFFHGKCYKKQRRWQKFERALHLKPRLSCLYPQQFPAVLPDETAAAAFYETAVAETVRLVPLFFSDALPKSDFSKNLHTGE